jgi:CRP-like cAMP-binding protein
LLAILRPGDYFGEIALLRQTPRTATVRGLTDLRMMRLSAAEFRRLLSGQIPEQTRGAIAAREDLARCTLLAHLGPRELELVRKHLREQRYAAGSDLVRQGDPADGFYILRDGQCEVLVQDATGSRRVNTLGPGDYFGEIALLQQSPRTATVRAVDEVVVWVLDRRDFDDLLRRYFDLAGPLARTARQRATASGLPLKRRGPALGSALPRGEPEAGRDQIATGH